MPQLSEPSQWTIIGNMPSIEHIAQSALRGFEGNNVADNFVDKLRPGDSITGHVIESNIYNSVKGSEVHNK